MDLSSEGLRNGDKSATENYNEFEGHVTHDNVRVLSLEREI